MDKVTLDLHREGCQRTGGYTLLIGQVDEKGYGHGYRIFGPKICLLGNDIHLTTVELDERDAREIFGYIRPLLGDECLADQSSAVGASTPTGATPTAGSAGPGSPPTSLVDPPSPGEVDASFPHGSGWRSRYEVELATGCWLWVARLTDDGYGLISRGGTCLAHRVVYEELVGPIPDGLQLDHNCHNVDATCVGGVGCQHRRCVNPAHLEPVTAYENNLRSASASAVNAAKTECTNGHPFTPENTYMWRGFRFCRACNRRSARASRSRRSVEVDA